MINEIYNLKVIHYADSDQVRIYKNPVVVRDMKEVDDDGVILQGTREMEKTFNPFTGQMEVMHDFDNERSRSNSMNRTINTIYSIARSNHWQYFFTMTFNPEKVKSDDYDACVKSMTKWLENQRRRYAPDLKYLLVPELHKDGKKWHFHGLFSDIGNIPLVDSGKKDNKGRVIWNIGSYKLGFTTVTRIGDSERSCSYIMKYINKDLCAMSFGRKRYWASRNLLRPVEEIFSLDAETLDRMFHLEEYENLKKDLKEGDVINLKNNNLLDKFQFISQRGEIGYMKKVTGLYNEIVYLEMQGRLDLDGLQHFDD